MMWRKLVTFAFLALLTACSGFIDRMHQQMDVEDGNYAPQSSIQSSGSPQFDMYRKGPSIGQRQQGPNTATDPLVQPTVKRYYQPEQQVQRKRYKADDLLDNSNQGSLWSGSGNENYLFSSDKVRKIGDIILIEVQGKLKNEITMELKRMFPPPFPQKKPGTEGAAAGQATPPAANAAAAPAAEAATGDDAQYKEDETVYDRFTSLIIEEIDRKHVLLKAQKNLLYNKRKRLVEVQALVSRSDIRPDDTVSSNSFLETTIEVLK